MGRDSETAVGLTKWLTKNPINSGIGRSRGAKFKFFRFHYSRDGRNREALKRVGSNHRDGVKQTTGEKEGSHPTLVEGECGEKKGKGGPWPTNLRQRM